MMDINKIHETIFYNKQNIESKKEKEVGELVSTFNLSNEGVDKVVSKLLFCDKTRSHLTRMHVIPNELIDFIRLDWEQKKKRDYDARFQNYLNKKPLAHFKSKYIEGSLNPLQTAARMGSSEADKLAFNEIGMCELCGHVGAQKRGDSKVSFYCFKNKEKMSKPWSEQFDCLNFTSFLQVKS